MLNNMSICVCPKLYICILSYAKNQICTNVMYTIKFTWLDLKVVKDDQCGKNKISLKFCPYPGRYYAIAIKSPDGHLLISEPSCKLSFNSLNQCNPISSKSYCECRILVTHLEAGKVVKSSVILGSSDGFSYWMVLGVFGWKLQVPHLVAVVLKSRCRNFVGRCCCKCKIVWQFCSLIVCWFTCWVLSALPTQRR